MRINRHKKAAAQSAIETSSLEVNEKQNDRAANGEALDSFEKTSLLNKTLFDHATRKPLKKVEAQRKANIEASKIPFDFLGERSELKFIAQPSFNEFQKLIHDFDNCYRTSGQSMFFRMESVLIDPSKGEYSQSLDALDLGVKMQTLDDWYDQNQLQYKKDEQATKERIWKRDRKIEREGQGFGGKMTNKVLKSKTAAYTAKNRLTIRGNMFQLNNQICGKSLEEMLPRYGSRKGKHIAVRVSQFTINAILMAAGYGLSPVTFGASIIVSNQIQTAVTLTGEVIALKFDGAQKRKMVSHATIRGVQLEILRVPVIGTVLNYGENAAFGSAAVGIVATTLADWILESMSDRFTASISFDDLGDPSVLFEMNQRIDYLSRFLLPFGQYLLLHEKDPALQKKLRKTLKEHFKLLKTLEHQTIKALNFYRLGLLAGRVPPSLQDDIEQACKIAETQIRMNTHRTARQCLNVLLKQETLQSGA